MPSLSLLLLISCSSAALAALIYVPSLDRVLPDTRLLSAPSSGLDCDVCEAIVSIAQEAAVNVTFMDALVALLDDGCAALFPSQNVSVEVCDALAQDVTALFPWIEKQLQTLDWDVPIGFCSVFLPVCQNPCCNGNPSVPEQIHLSLLPSSPGGNQYSTLMSVTWVTLNETATSTVQYGPATSDPSQLLNSSIGFNSTYTFGGWVGVIHSAIMQGLIPGAAYSYRVGDELGGWSALYNFSALPSNLGTAERPFRIAQIGDMSFENASDLTVASLTRLAVNGEIDVLLHVGDISYADGYQPHWDAFMNKVQPISTIVPYMVTPGNHEFWANFTAYKARFQMPNAASTENMYYSFDAGNVHFCMFDTETVIDTADVDPVELAWLSNDLATVNRTAQPWIIAGGHRPLYCSNNDKTQCGVFAEILRLEAEDIFLTAAVDLVVSAHEHGYERSYPVALNGTVISMNYTNPASPVYIVNGAAGNREGNQLPSGDAPWSAFQSGAIGYATIVITGSESMAYTFFDSNGTAIDAFTIVKS